MITFSKDTVRFVSMVNNSYLIIYMKNGLWPSYFIYQFKIMSFNVFTAFRFTYNDGGTRKAIKEYTLDLPESILSMFKSGDLETMKLAISLINKYVKQ